MNTVLNFWRKLSQVCNSCLLSINLLKWCVKGKCQGSLVSGKQQWFLQANPVGRRQKLDWWWRNLFSQICKALLLGRSLAKSSIIHWTAFSPDISKFNLMRGECSLFDVKFSEQNLKIEITWLKLRRVKMRQRRAKLGKKPEQVAMQRKAHPNCFQAL